MSQLFGNFAKVACPDTYVSRCQQGATFLNEKSTLLRVTGSMNDLNCCKFQ